MLFVHCSVVVHKATDEGLNRDLGDGGSALENNTNHHCVVDQADALEVFQVYATPRKYGEPVYSSIIMEHTFGFSYGKPFVGKYVPAPVDFTHVHFTLSATSAGRQFDRLALIFVADSEVWRTSTAEPTYSGIHFGYTKDVTRFISLLRQEQPFVFEMGNLVDDTYTGKFAIKLTAEFYYAPDQTGDDADIIIPVSTKRSKEGKPSHFSIPQDKAEATIILPKTTRKAVALISASGNAGEEFWYTNVVSQYKQSFPNTYLPAHGPHRELQLYIDGKLAGVTFPFPIIFTGGIAPGLWRPIVGISAYDLPMYEVDLTPFLPLLWKGSKVEIKVDSNDPDEAGIENDWIVSANIFGWSGLAEGSGEITQFDVSEFNVTTTASLSNDHTSLNVSSIAARTIKVTSSLSFGDGEAQDYESMTNIQSMNEQEFINKGARQKVHARIVVIEESTMLGSREYTYPLIVDSMYEFEPVFRISAAVSHGRSADEKKDSTELWTHQSGTSYYIGQDSKGNGPYGGGETEQGFISVQGKDQYWRSVRAVNGYVVRDLQVREDGTTEEKNTLSTMNSDSEEAKLKTLLSGCLRTYNEKVMLQQYQGHDEENDPSIKACIRQMLGRGPI
ncbi:peptide N-acetyl-beta-D-glucosaminyl asparaginase amidase A-domain-containing protein [Dipodascopsis uninucleata]